MRPLQGKVVLLTGASRGLGVEMARAFARRGSRLALAARSAEGLQRVCQELVGMGAEAVAVPTDVGDLDSLRSLVERVGAELGPVDVLVNNAGVEHVAPFEELAPERIEEIVRVNVTGLAWLTRLVVPSMLERGAGHVCNVASLAGLVADPYNAVYSASKHAVVGLSRALRAELGGRGVEVSCVCPTYVSEAGMFAAFERRPPRLAGLVNPRQVAGAVLRAVEHNRAQVVVGPPAGVVGGAVADLAPELTIRVMKALGQVAFSRGLAETARSRQGQREQAASPRADRGAGSPEPG